LHNTHTQPSQPAPTTLPGGVKGNSICANAQGSCWRAAAIVAAPAAAVSIAVTATVSLLPILVDCCLCPRPSLLQPLSSPPIAVAVTVIVFVVIVIVVIVVIVIIDVILIVVVVFAVIVFVVLVVLIVVFAVLVVVVVVFVVFLVIIVVFVVINKLLLPPPPCLRCQF
jgi:hypothetical protein